MILGGILELIAIICYVAIEELSETNEKGLFNNHSRRGRNAPDLDCDLDWG